MRAIRVLLRVCIGLLFIGHGTQKLFGWFGGKGLEPTAEGFEQLGLRPGRRNAVAAGVTEAGGGALLVLGAATPLAAAMLTGAMATAIDRVHRERGPWVTEGGYEYNLVLIGAVNSLVEAGPGAPSVDGALGVRWCGPLWALASLGGGLAGAALVKQLADHSEPPAEQAAEAEREVAA
jgi:putative oxidoreductase